MTGSKPVIWFIAILVASLACSTSGTSAPVSNGPLDSNSLATVVAGTAGAAAAETAQINLLNNFQSTETAQANPASATEMPVTPPVSAEGTSLLKLNDGSSVFTDSQGGYSIVVPSVWLAMRVGEQEFINAQISPANSDPQLQNAFSVLRSRDPKIYRLVAIDTSTSDLKTGFVSTLSVAWERDDSETIEQNIAGAKKDFPKLSPPEKITYADVGTTSTHISMGIIESTSNGTTPSKQSVTLYQKQIIFKLKKGTLYFDMAAAIELKEKFVPGLDFMTDQIKMLP